MGMKDKKLAKEIAERRMIMIAPLVGVLSSQEEYYCKRREISETYPPALCSGMWMPTMNRE